MAELKLYTAESSGTSSEDEVSSSSSTSTISGAGGEMKGRGHHTQPRYGTTPTAAAMQGGGDWRVDRNPAGAKQWHPGISLKHTPARARAPAGGDGGNGPVIEEQLQQAKTLEQPSLSNPTDQSVVLDSLHSINSQLGELLSRVGPSPAAAHRSQTLLLGHTPLVADSSTTRSTACIAVVGSAVEVMRVCYCDHRWADPVTLVGNDFKQRRQPYLGK